MSVDPYSECPCGSGKKLKFCCSDLYADLDKVHRMLEGDQPRAALNHVEKTLAKHPNRGSLLDLKGTIQVSLGDLDDARETVRQYLEVDPQNPSAHAQAAVLACSAQQQLEAVASLQRALELVSDHIPARVLQAVGLVGQSLLVGGDMIAARAHLWLYQGIAGEGDSSAMELLMKLNRVSGLPLLLRDNLYMRELPEGHEAEERHDHAQMLASRGQWARAADELAQLSEQFPDLLVLAYNHALVRGWLGESERFITGLRGFSAGHAKGQVEWDDAVEAEALAQWLGEGLREKPAEVVRTTLAVVDEDQLIDRLSRDPQTDAQGVDPAELAGADGPPPRCAFLLLDRHLPETGEGLAEDGVPRVLGILSYFGKQTDRDRRLEFVCDRNERYGASIEALRSVAGDAVGDVLSEEVIGESSTTSVYEARWRFPADTNISQRRELLSGYRTRATLEEWPQRPLRALEGKTPHEANKEAGLRVSLAAAVLNLEQEARGSVSAATFDDLRRSLNLPVTQPIDARAVDLVMLPFVRLPRVDLRQADDEELLSLFNRAQLAGADEAVRQIAEAALERDSLGQVIAREQLYERLVSLEPDPAKALEWLDRARADNNEQGQSCAPWDILELELRVLNGEIDDANRLVQHLRDEHLSEPGVADQLYRMLYALGVAPTQGAAPQEAHAAPAAGAPAQPSALWTPDGGSDRPSGEKKIWTPS